MMAGNPSCWSMSNMRSSSQEHHNTSSAFLPTCPSLLAQYHEGFDHHRSSSSSSMISLNSSFANDDDLEQLPHSWSQLLVGGFANEEDKFASIHHFHSKKVDNWEDQIALNQSLIRGFPNNIGVHIKQESSHSSQLYGSAHGDVDDDHELINDNQSTCRGAPIWSHQQVIMPVSSPRYTNTSLGSNLFDFSRNNESDGRTQNTDRSSECNSTSTGGVSKKAKAQPSLTQPPLKVRKEKLGERITALHQIVSPFGKTDTASVLLEAMGCIRLLHGQIEALSSPYLCNTSTNMRHQQHGNENGHKKDLKSIGLCLVPESCTHHFGNDNGADYWTLAPGGGFG